MDLVENIWAWGYLNRNLQNWKIKEAKMKKKQNKTKQNVQELWENYKRYNIWGHVMGIPQQEERKKVLKIIINKNVS